MNQLEINLINKKTCTVLKSIVKLFMEGYPFEVGLSYEMCLSIVDTLGYFLMISMSDNRKFRTLSMPPVWIEPTLEKNSITASVHLHTLLLKVPTL